MTYFNGVRGETVRKALEAPPGVALQTTVKALLDPFRPPHNVRIRFRSLPRTPFRTVSEGEFCEVRLGGVLGSRGTYAVARSFSWRTTRTGQWA